MKKKLCVVAIMASLMLWGCTQEKKQAEAPAPESMTAVEQAQEKMGEATEAVKEATKAAGEAVEEVVAEKAAVLEEKTAVAVEKSKQAAADIKTAVEKKIAPSAEPVAEKSKPAAPEKLTTTVETVVIENNNGKVVLSHKKHAEAHGCTACHGAQKPGPLKLGKDAAHAVCQGCHKTNQAGPTACNQCHQKKPKAIEGC